MTEHIQARYGVKKLYKAEMLEIIATAILIVSLVLQIVFPIASILSIVVSVLGIIAFIMMMVGLNQAGKDAKGYKTAFTLIIFVIIVSVCSAVLQVLCFVDADINITIGTYTMSAIVGNVSEIIVTILEIVSYYKIIMTTVELLKANKEDEIASTGKSVWIFVMVTIVASVIFVLVAAIFAAIGTPVFAILSLVCVVLVAVLQLIGYIKYVVFLKKSYPNL